MVFKVPEKSIIKKTNKKKTAFPVKESSICSHAAALYTNSHATSLLAKREKVKTHTATPSADCLVSCCELEIYNNSTRECP